MKSDVIIALEGLIHAGKTTLINRVRGLAGESICCIDEYSFYRGNRNFPDFPRTSNEALDANQFFVDLEKQRFANRIVSLPTVLDRSFLSVLAYHYATEKVTHGKIVCFSQSMDFFTRDYFCYMPNIVVYAEIPLEVMFKRHRAETAIYKPILLDREFNRHLIHFYNNVTKFFPQITLHRIDAAAPEKEVLDESMRILGCYI
jgi:thymidylate kinase